MSELEEEDQKSAIIRLESEVAGIKGAVASIASEVRAMSAAFSASQRTNWPMIISLVGMLLTVTAGVWYIIDLKSQNSLIPVMIANAISLKDREGLESRAHANSESIIVLREAMAANKEKYLGVEGQFKTLGDGTNRFMAEQHRMNSIIWNSGPLGKVAPYPAGPFFFPSYSQHLPNP